MRFIAVSSEQDGELACAVDQLHQIQTQGRNKSETIFLIVKHEAVCSHKSQGYSRWIRHTVKRVLGSKVTEHRCCSLDWEGGISHCDIFYFSITLGRSLMAPLHFGAGKQWQHPNTTQRVGTLEVML